MKKLFLLVVVFSGCFAVAQFEKATAENTSIADQSIEITLVKDSVDELIETTKEIANNGSGATELSVRRISYDPSVSDVTVLAAGIETKGQPSRVVQLDKIRVHSASTDKLGINNFKTIEIPYDGVVSGSVVWHTTRTKNKSKDSPPFSMGFVYGFLRKELSSSVTIISEAPLVTQQTGVYQALEIKQTQKDSKFVTTIKLNKPILAVGPSEVDKLSDFEIQTRVPRVQVSTTRTWEKHIAIARRGYDEGLKQELPASVQGLLGEISKIPNVTAKVEKILGWVAVNMTYSQRWLGTNAGYEPRKPTEIIQSKVGDCKDFAMITLAIMKKAGIESEPVLVGMFDENDRTKFLRSPVFILQPLPSFDYFNHIVVRYKNGNDSYIIDPGRGIADAKRLPFFLANSWMLPLGSDKGVPFVSKAANVPDYAGVKLDTTLVRKPDGQFSVSSTVTFTGETANFLRLVFFQAGAKQVESFVSLLGAGNKQGAFSVQTVTPIDRTDGPLKFELRYVAGQSVPANKPNEVRLLPHFLPMLISKAGEQGYMRFPTMDFETIETITVNDSFVQDEEKKDCLVLAPSFGIERIVKNEAKNVVITDKTWIRDWPRTARSPELSDQSTLAGHAMSSCLSAAEMDIEVRKEKQVSFEQKLQKIKTFVPLKETLKSSVEQRAELRRINYYLAIEPNNEKLHVEKSLIIEDLGYLSGDKFMHAYLVEAERVLEEALPKFPNKKAEFVARIGKFRAQRMEDKKAQQSFDAAYAIDPRDFHVLRLAGLIYEMKGKYQEAIAYYLAASKATQDEDLIDVALDKRANVLCWDMGSCDELKISYEKALAKKPNDPWRLHNLAIVHNKLNDSMKAIELVEKALSIMSFGAAEHALVSYIIKEVNTRHLGNRVPANAPGKSTEDLLIRAYQMDSKNEEVLYHMVVHHARKSKTTPASLQIAQQYMKELQDLPNKTFFLVKAMQEYQTVTGGKPGTVPYEALNMKRVGE